jgi:hypothetical protein
MKKDNNSLLRTWRTTPIRRFSRTEIVVALLLLFLLFFFLPLEYDDIKAKTFLYPMILISIAFVVYKTFPDPSELRTFVFSIGGGAYLLCALLYIPNLIGFCASRDHGTLYVNKKDPSRRITMTGYSCFLTDEDTQLYEERTITQHIKWVTSFDEKPVDTTKWQFHPE